MRDSSARIASLDGLRGVSILLVVLGHLAGTQGFPFNQAQVHANFIATLGVRVFFVISGYLITRLLLIEQQSAGSIRLGTFYFRRIFRILVPYYAFLAAVVIGARLGWLELAPGDLGYALTYISNYHLSTGWNLAHTWSLAVEEQFYLIWPAILVLLGVRRAMWVAAVYLATAPFGRLFVWYFQPALRDGIGHTFGTCADSIAAGCLLAGMGDWLWKNPRYRALLQSAWFFLVPVAVVATGVVDERPRMAFTIGALVVNLGVAIVVDRCLRMPWRRATRLLSAPPVVAVGRISYSIYLWQQLFLNRTAPAWATAFPRNLALVALAGTASYYLIEKTSLSARVVLQQKLQRVLSLHRRAGEPMPPPKRAAA